MKTIFTILPLMFSCMLNAQTITYSGFSQSLTDTADIRIANNASFNTALVSITGTGATWDASALLPLAGAPAIHMSFHSPASTPQGSQYPFSNYAEFDPALPSLISVEYSSYVNDSVSVWGTYSPDGTHEIFQDPDKRLIFPFTHGQSFTDNYKKTNYSDATTISSYQNGTRTVTFAGHGTLILPQGPFTNVGLVTEIRTNNLGADSYVYTWYDLGNGKKLLFRSENTGNITTAYSATATATGIIEQTITTGAVVFPNPVINTATLQLKSNMPVKNGIMKIYTPSGQEVKSFTANSHIISFDRNGLPSGIYFYRIQADGLNINGKLIIR